MRLSWKIVTAVSCFIFMANFCIVTAELSTFSFPTAASAYDLSGRAFYFFPEQTEEQALFVVSTDSGGSYTQKDLQKFLVQGGMNCPENIRYSSHPKTILYCDPVSLKETIRLILRI